MMHLILVSSKPGACQSASKKAREFLPKSNGNALELTGIDGSNPLGFLAAVGVLNVLHGAGKCESRLAWRRSVIWRPCLFGLPISDQKDLAQMVAEAMRGAAVSTEASEERGRAKRRLDEAKKKVKNRHQDIKKRTLRGREREQTLETELAPLERELNDMRQAYIAALRQAVPRPELALGANIDCTADDYRELAVSLTESAAWNARDSADLLAAFTNDACLHESPNKQKEGKISPSPFAFISGGGHQDFLDSVRQLLDNVSDARIEAALFERWSYADEGLSMRWDPVEDRRHALMDRDPTAAGNKPRTVWMANLLAYRALALFASAPRAHGLATTGWSRQSDGDAFSWPLWTHPIGPDSIRSLLLLGELHEPAPDRRKLRAIGVQTAYRSRRIRVPPTGANFKINFTPSREI
jgi:hypothetical protein